MIYHVAPIRSPGIYFFSSLSGWASISEGRLLESDVYCFQILNQFNANEMAEKLQIYASKYTFHIHLGVGVY